MPELMRTMMKKKYQLDAFVELAIDAMGVETVRRMLEQAASVADLLMEIHANVEADH